MESVVPDEEDIIIKCGLEEMVKTFFKDSVIVWHNPNVNSEEYQQYFVQLKKFCEVFTFTEWRDASSFIQEAKTACQVITSGAEGELLVKDIFSRPTVTEINVFCGNKEYRLAWVNDYQKVSCIETHIEDVLAKIKENLREWFKFTSTLKFDRPEFAPIFNNSDKSQMNHLHPYLKVIPTFKNRVQAKNDFINLSKAIYSGANIIHIERFEQSYNDYNKEQILKLYARNSFLFHVTNNSLRIATPESLQYCRLPITDMQRAIKEQYQEKSKNFNGLLFRGASLSQEEWLNFKENVNREIEMQYFLSVTRDKLLAELSMSLDSSKNVFITIIVPKGPYEEEQGFAEVEKFSQHPPEEEILFNVRSRFTVLETEDKYSEDFQFRHLVLLYGAEGFRKFISGENPVQEFVIPKVKNISCNHCKTSRYDTPEKMFFIPITDVQEEIYYCIRCIDQRDGPFFCAPLMEEAEEPYKIKIQGCLLMNSYETKIPFYGYECCICQAKKQKFYFTCTDCSEKRDRRCQECFGVLSSCVQARHNIILETNPFSFWCEKMPQLELNQLKFENYFAISNDNIFQQAEMYFESHLYEKAIEYYKVFLKKNKVKGKDSNLAICFHNLGDVYQALGKYKKMRKYYLKSLDISKLVHGWNHPALANIYKKIGKIFSNQGEYKIALEFFFKVLEISRSVYGESHSVAAPSENYTGSENRGESQKSPEYFSKSLGICISFDWENHPDIATSYSEIGEIYVNLGEYDKALGSFSKSLDICKLLYGDNHPAVATSYRNIGWTYACIGEYHQTLEYFSKSLNICKLFYGDNHSAVATSYSNIGWIYTRLGKYNKAIEYFSRSLGIYKSFYRGNHPAIAASSNNIEWISTSLEEYNKALEYFSKFGDNHPAIAISYRNIGGIYANLRKDKKALEYFWKSLDICYSFYGENHSAVATSYNKIGWIYTRLGKYNKAIEYFSRSLGIYKSFYRGNHPAIAISYRNIGWISTRLGKYNKAIEYFLKSLDICYSFYGENHPNVATVYENLGDVYFDLGEYHKALDHFSKSLNIYELFYGENHPAIAFSYNDIGSTYTHLGKYNKAIEYFLKSLDICYSFYGENHPAIAFSYNDIGSTYTHLGKYNKAIEYFLKSLDICYSFYGENHPHVATAYENLGDVYFDQGEYNKALEHFSKSLDIAKSAEIQSHSSIARLYKKIRNVYSSQRESSQAIEWFSKPISHSIAASDRNLGFVEKSLEANQEALKENLKALETRQLISKEGQLHLGEREMNPRSLDVIDKQSSNSRNHESDAEKSRDLEKNLDLARSNTKLGFQWKSKGDYEKAIECHQKALSTSITIYGERHLEVSVSYSNLASSYNTLGEYQKAADSLLKAINIRESIQEKDGETIASLFNNLALTYESLEKNEEAFEYHTKALNIRKSIYGENHPDIADSYNNLAIVCEIVKKDKEALKYYECALEIRKSIYEENHPDIAASYDSLASILKNLGDFKKAFEYKKKAIQMTNAANNESNIVTDMKYLDLIEKPGIEENQSLIRSLMEPILIDKDF